VRLIITVLVCSVVIVGGFFGYKQFQRSEMKQGARDYAMTTVTRTAKDFDPEAEPVIVDYLDRHLEETFSAHYRSGGLTKPAEFNDITFARDLFDRMHEAIRGDDASEEVKRFAHRLYIRSRPWDERGFGPAAPEAAADSSDDSTPESPDEQP